MTHPSFNGFTDWIGIPVDSLDRSYLVYFDVTTDNKFKYGGSLDTMDSRSLKKFIKQVQDGEIVRIGGE